MERHSAGEMQGDGDRRADITKIGREGEALERQRDRYIDRLITTPC